MRTLRTPLRTLVRIRHNRQEQSERRLAHAVSHYRSIHQHIADLQERKRVAIRTQGSTTSMGTTGKGNYDLEMREVIDRYLALLRSQQRQSEKELPQAQRQLSLRQQEYHRAYREHSAYQGLYRQRVHQHQLVERRKLQHRYDEIATSQWANVVKEIIPPETVIKGK